MSTSNFTHKPKAGFAIIDLLLLAVFLGSFVILAGAAWENARKRDQSAECLSNQRQLITAWTRHASDNEETVCNNFTLPATLQTITDGTFENWANNVMTWSTGTGTDSRSVTNLDWAKRSVLGPYAVDPVGMAKCPRDNYLSAVQRSAKWKARVRSYAMNAFMGRADTSPSPPNGRSWAEGGAYRQFLKTRDIPDPGKTWVTIEEHADSINDGFFINGISASAWEDRPSTFHYGGTTFSFADGHAELHKWKSRTSLYPVRFMYGSSRPFDALGRQDFAWYKDQVGYVRYP